jgi:hypothetical protein
MYPSFRVAVYFLSAPNKAEENLVASPKHTGNKPVAKGSSVPVCPAFDALNKRLVICSALLEVIPMGLSSSRTPLMFRLIGLVSKIYRLNNGMNLKKL